MTNNNIDDTEEREGLAALAAQYLEVERYRAPMQEFGRQMSEMIGHEEIRHLQHAQSIVDGLTQQFGLQRLEVKFSRAHSRATGRTWKRGQITIYTRFGRRVRTLLHEVAHHLAGFEQNHNKQFKRAFYAITEWYAQNKDNLEYKLSYEEAMHALMEEEGTG